jgi:TonB family protein
MKAGLSKAVAAAVACAVLGSGVVSAATPQATDQQVVREYLAKVALDIDAAGQVATVGLSADVPPMLAGPAREAIRHWRFKPPVREGHAVTARTYARVTLQLVRQPGGNYGLRATYGSNGPKLTYTQAPGYPADEIRRRNEGYLKVDAVVRPDGTLADIRVASSHFALNSRTQDFQRVAIETMKHCHAMPELVDGKPVATRIEVPMTFSLGGGRPREVSPPESGQGTDNPVGPVPGPIGQAVALDSPVHLLMGSPSG